LAEAQKESFREMPWYERLMAGAGKTALASGLGGATAHPGMRREDIQRESLKQQQVEEAFPRYEQMAAGDPWAATGEIGADVAMLATPTGKLARLGKLAKLGKTGKAMVGGGLAGLGSAGFHQMQNIGTGRDISPAERWLGSLFETGVSALLPGVGTKVAPLAKGAASKIIETATKLSRKIKGQKTMNPQQIKNYFDNYAGWRNILSSEKKLLKHQDVLGNQFDELMDNISKGKRVNINNAISKTRNRVKRLMQTGGINLEDAPNVLKKIDEFESMVKPLADKGGTVNFKIAQRFKQKTLDDLAQYDKPSPLGTFDPTLRAPAQAARSTRQNVLGEMAKVEPALSPINKAYREMADVRPFVQQTAERFRANRGLSLQDVAGLAALTVGTGGAYPLLKAIPFAISRGQKSPMLAKSLWELGRTAEKMERGLQYPIAGIPLGQLGMQTGRSTLSTLAQ